MAVNLPKALLVDLDDTILLYDAVAPEAWQQVCDRFAPRIPGLPAERLRAAIGEASDWYWSDPERNRSGRLNLPATRREIVSIAFESLDVSVSELVGELAEAYDEARTKLIAPSRGAIDTLRHLRGNGVKLALVTNGASQPQRSKIQRFNLAPLFDSILVEGEFGAGKPDPRVYLHSLDQIDARPSEAWMVGDNLEFDVGAPQKLGIKGIWVDWQAEGLPVTSAVKPDRIVNRISELVDGT